MWISGPNALQNYLNDSNLASFEIVFNLKCVYVVYVRKITLANRRRNKTNLLCCFLCVSIANVFVFRENDITGVIENGFAVDHDSYGEHKLHELKPGGRDIPVTEQNKQEYVEFVFWWTFCHNQIFRNVRPSWPRQHSIYMRRWVPM